MIGKILDESHMAFKLESGEILLISNNDTEKIASKLVTEMMINKAAHVLMIKDAGLQRARELYDVYKNEKHDMDDKMKKDYLKCILKYLSDDNMLEITNLEMEIKRINLDQS